MRTYAPRVGKNAHPECNIVVKKGTRTKNNSHYLYIGFREGAEDLLGSDSVYVKRFDDCLLIRPYKGQDFTSTKVYNIHKQKECTTEGPHITATLHITKDANLDLFDFVGEDGNAFYNLVKDKYTNCYYIKKGVNSDRTN